MIIKPYTQLSTAIIYEREHACLYLPHCATKPDYLFWYTHYTSIIYIVQTHAILTVKEYYLVYYIV